MQPCNFVCDDCTRTLCTQGNPTLEPTPEELEAMEEEANREFFGSPNRSGKKGKRLWDDGNGGGN